MQEIPGFERLQNLRTDRLSPFARIKTQPHPIFTSKPPPPSPSPVTTTATNDVGHHHHHQMTMSSRATSPEFQRRSKLPLPTRYTTPSSPNTSTTTPTQQHRRHSHSHPPSPPLSPPATEIPIPQTPSRSLRNVRWDSHAAMLDDSEPFQHVSPHRRDSTDSIRENERFSPIPYVFSPPDSPPPLSLYTSVALLHYHIHQAPQTGSMAATLQGGGSAARGDEMTEEAVLSSGSSSNSSARSRNSSVLGSPARTTRVLPAEQALEEFIAVERALTRSPYILPGDMLPSTRDDVNDEKGEENPKVELDKVKVERAEEEKKVGDKELELPVASGETYEDAVSELVDEYSRQDDTDVKSLRSVPSSPFIEFTTPRIPVPESLPATPSPSQPLHESTLSSTTVAAAEPLATNISVEESSHETTEQNLTLPLDQTTSITRMPSIQRRGKEYLEQYIAKRTNTPNKKSAKTTKPAIPTTGPAVSPMTVFFSIFITLSVVTNIILTTIILRNPAIYSRLMNPVPVQVEEISPIVNEPVTTNWWWRNEEKEVTSPVPTSTRLVVTTVSARTRLVLFSRIWMRRPENVEAVAGASELKGEGDSLEVRKVFGCWKRAKIFINELLGKYFGI